MMEKRNDDQVLQHKFQIPLKSKEPVSKERQQLADLAKKMVSGEVKWSNDVILDPKWDAILKEEAAKKAKNAQPEVVPEVKQETETTKKTQPQ